MLFAHWMLLLATILPIVAVAIAKSQPGFDNHNPRAYLEQLPEGSMHKRMVAAQANSWEALIMFAPAVLLATMLHVQASTLNLLAGVFIVARIVYLWCYAKDLATQRSLVWTVGMVCILGLYIASALS
ncbi:MAPEG family protein [Hydromonas duriensis]|uniref:Putative MAPEG superfamily protein n=1 Tax=Hydromonas duriensis TaxID=1527608 RepID=A0A4R6YAJ4_9BURK|nr:MAPEG family protein [Hydromonas duriensis]TDR32555.1 putative MAPEG superfamily protein [Hydromonas duriensis]